MGEYATVACKGKFGYESKALAEEVLKRKKRGNTMTAYKCRTCRRWHIGSTFSREVKRYKRKKMQLKAAA